MDIRQLKYFLMIAEEGQITSAAKKLQMAQPPLSQQLKQLEEELGVKLVERGPRSVHLTSAGEILKNRAEQIVELTESTVKEIADFVKGWQGTLSIGTVSSSGATLMKERLIEFFRDHPGVRCEIHEGNTFHIIDLLTAGIVEVGVVRTPFHTGENIGCRYADWEPMVAVMTHENDWAAASSRIELSELRDKPLIIYRRFEQLIQETCMNQGFEPIVFCKNDDARTTLLWVGTGLGIGIVPRSAVALADCSNLVVKEINCDDLRTRIAAIWKKDKYMSSLAARFIESFS